MTKAATMFGPSAITQEFSKKLLKWQAYAGGESTKCAMFKIQAGEAENLRGIFGYGKRGRGVKFFSLNVK